MITILTTTDYKQFCVDTINLVGRLDELVSIEREKKIETDKVIIVKDKTIVSTLDWNDTEPPYIFPSIPLTETNLLALVFYKLGNVQKSFEYLKENDELYKHLLIGANIQHGYAITKEQIEFAAKTSQHNLAIIYNFGNVEEVVDKPTLQSYYEEAIKMGLTNSEKLFTVKYYSNLLIDNGLQKDAEKLIRSVEDKIQTDEEKNAFTVSLTNCLSAQVQLPYDEALLEEIATLQQEAVKYYEKLDLKINAGLVLINASEIANFQNNFVLSKDLITQAIKHFREEDIPEFLGEAVFQKAILLYTWSKNGSPEYYKPAINTFQNALKIFKKDTHPRKFADIHHNLALIYSEIKVSENEKPIWTAFCASSFKEALGFYNKQEFPYQFAMVAHNYATALMGFPEAKLHNNMDKAFGLFEEALDVRNAKEYPFERALTLLNQLELYWLIHNEDKADEMKNFEDMRNKALEVLQLVDEEDLQSQAKEHLSSLEKLKSFIA